MNASVAYKLPTRQPFEWRAGIGLGIAWVIAEFLGPFVALILNDGGIIESFFGEQAKGVETSRVNYVYKQR